MNHKDTKKLKRNRIALFLIGVLVLLTGNVIQAQDSIWQVIDPKSIFAPDVEVVKTWPVLKYDNTERLIRYFDPATMGWRSFQYPAELSGIEWSFTYATGEYLLLTGIVGWLEKYDDSREISAEYFWVIDVNTGHFSRPSEQCGRVQSKSDNGIWVAFDDSSGQVFCNTSTGAMTKPLPSAFDSSTRCLLGFYGGQSNNSPDRQWLLFHDCALDFSINLYSYNLSNDNINHIGTLENWQDLGIHSWFDEKNVILYASRRIRTSLPAVYVADVTKSDSLSFIAIYPQFNSSKFIWGDAKEDVASSTTLIEVNTYDMTTKTRSQLLRFTCETRADECIFGLTKSNDASTRVAIADSPPDVLGEGLLVYDLASQQSIYQTNARVPGEEIAWADHDTLVYLDRQIQGQKLHIVKFSGVRVADEVVIQDVHYGRLWEYLSSDGKYLTISDHNRIRLQSVATGEVHVIAEVNDENAVFSTFWEKDGLLRIGLSCCRAPFTYYWTVRVSDGNIAQ